MKKFAVVLLITLMVIPHVHGATPGEPKYMRTFEGYLSVGESVIIGNYTITVVNFLYNQNTWPPLVLLKLRDNRNFQTKTFTLSPGQSYSYNDINVSLVYIKNPLSDNPQALVEVYSKPTTVFYGVAHPGMNFTYGPLQLSVLDIKNGSVLMRYHKNGTTDYAYFGVGAHVFYDTYVVIYQISNDTALMKILVPKYVAYSVVEGTIIVVTNVSFSPVEVGGTFQLNVTLKNIGSMTARYVRVYLYSKPLVQEQETTQKVLLPTVSIPSFESEIPFASYRQGPVQYTGLLPPGHEKTLHFQLIASKTLRPDVYPLYVSLEYSDENGVIKTEQFEVGIPVNDVYRPKVVIESFTTKPNPVEPASNFTVVVKVKNRGNAPAYHVRVELLPTKPKEEQQTYSLFPTGGETNEQANIYPILKQSSLYFDELPVNGSGNGTLEFAVKDVSAGVYPLYAVIMYEDENGVSYKEEATFGVQVSGRPRLKVYIGNVWISDGKYNFEVDVANDGKAPARGVTVSISSPVISLFPLGERYVGTVEPMDYDSVNFEVLNSTIRAGRYPVVVRVTYMTVNGSFKSFNQTISLQLPSNISSRRKYEYYYGAGAIIVFLGIIAWRLRRG
ncbi:hypothetical protein [Thermococcus sp.]|uniref:COG1361 S-layer family protein n=1 Tax=Thermococcus sp. TaxID=35749 RepID=UPI0025D03CE4|nr:hypothetical protein [Thermococcus sp.]